MRTRLLYRGFINALVKKLFPDPKVEVSGSEIVLVTVNQLENKLAVNLINMSGPHADTRVSRYDNIPSIGPLDVKIKTDKKPSKVMLQPRSHPMKYSYSNGILTTKINKVDIHSILVVE